MIKRAALAAAGLVVGVGVAAGVSEAAIGPVSQLTTAHVAKVEPAPSPTENLATAEPAPETTTPSPAPSPDDAPADDAPAADAPTAAPVEAPTAEPSAEAAPAPAPEPTTEPTEAAPAPEPVAPPAQESGTDGSSAAQGGFDQQMVALVNAEREAAGVAPLQYWDGLRSGALQHSTWMDGNDFQHASEATLNADTAAAGCSGGWAENIYWASDAGTSPEAAMSAYMNSPGHRANILDPDLRYVATGTVVTDGGLFNTQRFSYTCG